MAGDVKKRVVPMPDYPDIIPLHPELSDEELDQLIEKEIEESIQYTEWPEV